MENPTNSTDNNINVKDFKKEDSQKKENESLLRPIRTYKNDIANLVKDQKISTAKIVLAEQAKNHRLEQSIESENEKPKNKKVIKVIISIILFGLGISAFFVAIQFNIVPQTIKNFVPNLKNTEPEIINKENSIKLITNSKTNTEIRNEIINKFKNLNNEKLDQVIEFEILKNITDSEGNTTQQKITSEEFNRILNTNTSDKFIRSLNEKFIYGIYTDAKPTPFIILKTNDINLTFSEIFDWENRMYDDLLSVLDLKPEVPDFLRIEVPISTSTELTNEENATNTATTTIKVVNNPEPKFKKTEFKDVIISNKDSRAIVDDSGKMILIYSFIDEENIIITSNIDVFQQIVKRLSTQKLLR